MAKRRYGFDEAKYDRMVKEGRGTGTGAEYLPWIEIHDLSSQGLSVRGKGRKTGRTHHLLSNLERSVFLELDWADQVTDIREQFPLDREGTREITEQMGVRHPSDHGTDIVLTTDLLVDVNDGDETRLVAISVKKSGDLENDRTLAKLEIERRYWELRGVRWRLVTEKQVSEARALQLLWLHEWFWLDHLEVPHQGYWEERCEVLLARLASACDSRLCDFIDDLERVEGFAAGEALSAIRHLASRKRVSLSLDSPLKMQGPLSQLKLSVAPMQMHHERNAA
jgi:hypothetical protein